MVIAESKDPLLDLLEVRAEDRLQRNLAVCPAVHAPLRPLRVAPLLRAQLSSHADAWAADAAVLPWVLKLSMLSKPSRVYRGVKEVERRLPDAFLDVSAGFAGGVELGFTSTTRSPEVALQYSGEGTGSILVRAEGLMKCEV